MSDVFIGIHGCSSTIKQIIPIPYHYNLVLFIDRSAPDNWDAFEFVERWHQLFSDPVYSQRYIQGE
jgi:hypothetical protein